MGLQAAGFAFCQSLGYCAWRDWVFLTRSFWVRIQRVTLMGHMTPGKRLSHSHLGHLHGSEVGTKETVWEGEPNMHPKILRLFGVRIIFRILFLGNSGHRTVYENQVEVTLLKETFTFVKEISSCKGISPLDQEEKDDKISRNSHQ